MHRFSLAFLLALTVGFAEAPRIGIIDFYGLRKVPAEKARPALGGKGGAGLPSSHGEGGAGRGPTRRPLAEGGPGEPGVPGTVRKAGGGTPGHTAEGAAGVERR